MSLKRSLPIPLIANQGSRLWAWYSNYSSFYSSFSFSIFLSSSNLVKIRLFVAILCYFAININIIAYLLIIDDLAIGAMLIYSISQ